MIKEKEHNDTSLSEDKFVKYLHSKLDDKVLDFVEVLNAELDLLVFSGVIRDFALKHNGELRDLDLVAKRNFHQLEKLIKKFDGIKFSKNSFGGYKLKISNICVDIWNAEDTWALKEQKIQNCIFMEEDLPYSCFFNFSSIVFDIKRNKFIKSKKFNEFLKNKTLDIVLEDNPYPELCIINTFYYKDKYDLRISANLKKYLKANFYNIPQDKYEKIQIKHFNKVIYSHDMLKNRVNKLGKHTHPA
ncbi:hypothetical protein G5B30_12265 [Sphingobacterium sp. SGG-5]|uniref:hypothetical protein n=1 Tax=Sphingobacterium sp. SGG-5 TaxID=2710881 RepID=UPI0013EA5F66|nr:hypothetical protein [Sphingobacterium sp. SGG-5]NGM62690.1 hypothetical protein [Sphingobacterium sp. SGG-5]